MGRCNLLLSQPGLQPAKACRHLPPSHPPWLPGIAPSTTLRLGRLPSAAELAAAAAAATAAAVAAPVPLPPLPPRVAATVGARPSRAASGGTLPRLSPDQMAGGGQERGPASRRLWCGSRAQGGQLGSGGGGSGKMALRDWRAGMSSERRAVSFRMRAAHPEAAQPASGRQLQPPCDRRRPECDPVKLQRKRCGDNA